MAKQEKRARIKRLIKQIKGLSKQSEKHFQKIESEKGNKDTTPAYWLEESKRFEQQAKERKELLKKLEQKEKNKEEQLDKS